MSVISKGLEEIVATDTRLGDVRGQQGDCSTADTTSGNSPGMPLSRKLSICFDTTNCPIGLNWQNSKG